MNALATIDKDLLQIFYLLVIVDCLLTIVNFCILGINVKLFTDFYKVRRLTRDEEVSDGRSPL